MCTKALFVVPLLSSLLLLAGCVTKPKGVIREKKMVSLLADMQLAEAYATAEVYGEDVEFRRKELSGGVLEAYGVSQKDLDTTLSYYGRNLDEYYELYEKVNKELEKRRKKELKDRVVMPDDGVKNLWPFGQHSIVSSLGGSDSWILSIDDAKLDRGESLEWKMFMTPVQNVAGVLGVEYEDGSSESVNQTFTARSKISLNLQTDTGKTVKRIYGTMRLKDQRSLPLFVDSISLSHMPYDSLIYGRYRNQKRHFPMRRNEVKPDTTSAKVETPELATVEDKVLSPVVDAPAVDDNLDRPKKPGAPLKTTPARRARRQNR